jgi:formate-dependent nitrite reductase membrane component NrfD
MEDTMVEVDVFRSNHLVDPQLHIWGWEIPVYLFLGGIAAGIMVMTALLGLRTAPSERSRWGRLLPFAVPVVLSLGMGALFLDLENKWNVLSFYGSFQLTSPMSWGAWILTAVYPLAVLLGLAQTTDAEMNTACRCAPFLSRTVHLLRSIAKRHVDTIRQANLFAGIGLGVYTGILLSTLGARALWSSPVLGPLFLVSGLSTGAAFLMLFPLSKHEHHALRRWDMLAIGAEVALILLFILGLLTGGASGTQAASLFLGGEATAVFWSLVVALGLAVPFALEAVETRLSLRPTVMAPVLLLVGGFALRWILVTSGQLI